MSDSFVDLYWIPVAAGTKWRWRHWSLWLYEAVDAAWGRRPRVALLYHSALKIGLDGEVYALEIAPVPRKQAVPPAVTGPVGAKAAGRLRIFRYQLMCLPGASLPDEAWAVDSPIRLSADREFARALIELLPTVPAYTWGRRAPGTTEMWTSDSVVSWLLIRAGMDVESVAVPPNGRAPGWRAGIELAAVSAIGPVG